MHATVNRQRLREAIAGLRMIVKPSRSTLTIGREIEVGAFAGHPSNAEHPDGYLELRGVNFGFHAGISLRLPAFVTREGTTTIDLRDFESAVKAQTDSELELEIGAMHLQSKDRRKVLVIRSAISALAFPSAEPDLESQRTYERMADAKAAAGGADITISRRQMRALFSGPIECASNEENRPILNGVCFKRAADGWSEVCGTNGHRMWVTGTDEFELPEGQELIIPPILIRAALRVWKTDAQALRLVASPAQRGAIPRTKIPPKQGEPGEAQPPQIEREELSRPLPTIRIEGPGGTICCSAIDGPYPAYEQVLPALGKIKIGDRELRGTVAVADRQDLLERTRAIAPAASDQTGRTVVRMRKGEPLRLACGNADGAASTALEADITGDELTLGLNITYLNRLLAIAPGSKVRLQAHTPERAIRVDPIYDEDEERSRERQLGIIMPLRLLDGGTEQEMEETMQLVETTPRERVPVGPSADASYGG